MLRPGGMGTILRHASNRLLREGSLSVHFQAALNSSSSETDLVSWRQAGSGQCVWHVCMWVGVWAGSERGKAGRGQNTASVSGPRL